MTGSAPAAPAPAPADTPAPAALPNDPAALAARDAELTALFEHDPNRYQYEDNGRWANEHYELRKVQQAQADKTEAPPDSADDGIEADDIDAEPANGEEPSDAGEAEISADEAVGVDSYTPPAVDGVSWSDDALKPIIGVAARHGVSEAALTEALSVYAETIQQHQAKLAADDKTASMAMTEALTERLGSKEAYDGYVATAREAAKLMPKTLRDALKTARLPDGRKVAHLPELAEFLHQVAGRQGHATPQPQDSRSMLQRELADLDSLMVSNIDQYHRSWRNSGVSGSDRRLQIMRELGSEGPTKLSAAELQAEERRLVSLSKSDPDTFRFGGPPGQTPADRLQAIRMGRA